MIKVSELVVFTTVLENDDNILAVDMINKTMNIHLEPLHTKIVIGSDIYLQSGLNTVKLTVKGRTNLGKGIYQINFESKEDVSEEWLLGASYFTLSIETLPTKCDYHSQKLVVGDLEHLYESNFKRGWYGHFYPHNEGSLQFKLPETLIDGAKLYLYNIVDGKIEKLSTNLDKLLLWAKYGHIHIAEYKLAK